MVLISKLNEYKTEIMCQRLLAGRIVQNVVEIVILFVFFLTIASKYNDQLSENTIFSSVFYFLGLRDPPFQKIRYFLFVGTVGHSLY